MADSQRLKRLLPGYRQYDALRALRLNYTRKGVWTMLRARQVGTRHRGWWFVLFHPTEVARRMHAYAEGAFS